MNAWTNLIQKIRTRLPRQMAAFRFLNETSLNLRQCLIAQSHQLLNSKLQWQNINGSKRPIQKPICKIGREHKPDAKGIQSRSDFHSTVARHFNVGSFSFFIRRRV